MSARRVNPVAVTYLVILHALALAAFLLPVRPALVLTAIAIYVLEGLGSTVGLHRLLSHRSFACPRWVEYLLVSVAMMTGQGSPILWVATHRRHHRYSDREGDVHSPHQGFVYSHVGWMVDDFSTSPDDARYSKDLADDPYYRWLLRYRFVPQVATVLVLGVTFGVRGLPLAFFLPSVLWMHSTYCVNSVCHHPAMGTAPFETEDRSRNVGWVALLTFGEGWHNNHHAFPRSAQHGLGRGQIDVSHAVIRLLAWLGLAWNVQQPPARAGRATEPNNVLPKEIS
ncbi:Fatty acid desaturase [Minicystis rosea]|nr:Fatty acid desaturase [Minicystis rosea]